jgi:hypothetical protein
MTELGRSQSLTMVCTDRRMIPEPRWERLSFSLEQRLGQSEKFGPGSRSWMT